MASPYLSIVVPCLNEEDNVVPLHHQIVETCHKIGKPYEIIFVDDGSTDQTVEKLHQLSPITIISFRKTFGQTAAFDAGFKHASGEIIITMDADLQNDPADIPLLLSKLEQGFDVVSGWRKKRYDTIRKKIASSIINFARRTLMRDKIHDSSCSFKAYRKECFDHLDLYGEMHRFIPSLLTLQGFKVAEVIIHHRPRIAGKSKYNWQRMVKGFLDILAIWFWNKYANRPLHLFGTLGLIFIIIALISGIWATFLKVTAQVNYSETSLTDLTIFGFFTGFLFLLFGLGADMVSKTYYKSRDYPTYSIKHIIRQ